MTIYVEVAVNVPQITGVYDYHLPLELEGRVDAGHLVEVPFGTQQVQGVVLRRVLQPAVADTRAVSALIDPQAAVTPAQMALARHLSESTLAPLSACIGLMIPSGLNQLADVRYRLAEPVVPVHEGNLGAIQARLLEALRKRGTLSGRQIDRLISRADWRAAARTLVRRGWILSEAFLPPPGVSPKTVRTVTLACPPERLAEQLPALGRPGSDSCRRRGAILEFLKGEPGPVAVDWVYAASGGKLADLKFLAGLGLVTLGEGEIWRDPLEGVEFIASEPPVLTQDQAGVWQAIRAGLSAAFKGEAVTPFLLHGVTGSGKTEIYLQAVARTLEQGRQAIVLVPEIALTPQTVRRFMARFPGRVGLVHSRLSTGERYDTWRRARAGELDVVVGPRSALFTPAPRLGLIVVDECHDDSYYSGESQPFYHARTAAVAYARLAGAVCLLGSATPDLDSQYQATQGRWKYLRLPARILAHRQAVRDQLQRLELDARAGHYRPLEAQADTADLPPVEVIDMRRELKAGNRSIFSRRLQAALSEVLEKGQQAILFLNRRGSATYVFCRECGSVLRCPRCDLPLTYHSRPLPLLESISPAKPASGGSAAQLLCHRCGYRRRMPRECPQCGSERIRQYGTGTEKVEAEVQSLFPQARTLRWDFETTRQKGAHDLILSHFANQRADVLVGTQMLAKGLDLPLVTLVGVVLADVGLNLPDYRAAERSFQVLTQVAGRAGRSPLGGEVILQTFQPEHYAIQAAARHDYHAFYQRELEYRRQLRYPPFTQLVRLEYRHTDPFEAERAAQNLAAKLRDWLAADDRRGTDLIGPAPCFFARASGLYRWQIVLRGPNPASLLRGRPTGDWRVEVNPPDLL